MQTGKKNRFSSLALNLALVDQGMHIWARAKKAWKKKTYC